MRRMLHILLPAQVDRSFHGPRLPVYVFAVIAVISTLRSLIHLLAPDGGAGSIAGLDLASGRKGIVFAFALWGSSQLIYAVIQLLAAFRYRSLTPLMYLLLICETILRMWVGRTHPARFLHTPPGAIGNYVMLPLAAGMLARCLFGEERQSRLG